MAIAQRIEQGQAPLAVGGGESARVISSQVVEYPQHNPAAKRWRQGLDLVTTVGSADRRHDAGLRKLAQVIERDPAIVGFHVGHDRRGNLTLVKIHGAMIRYTLQGRREQWLRQRVTDLISRAVFLREYAAGNVLPGKVIAVISECALAEWPDDEALLCVVDCRLDQFGPVYAAAAKPAVRQVEYPQRRRNR